MFYCILHNLDLCESTADKEYPINGSSFEVPILASSLVSGNRETDTRTEIDMNYGTAKPSSRMFCVSTPDAIPAPSSFYNGVILTVYLTLAVCY